MNTSTPSTMTKASGVRITAGSRSNNSMVSGWLEILANSRGRTRSLQAIALRRLAGSGVEFQHRAEARGGGGAHLVDHHLDHRGNIEEADAALQERLDRDLVGGAQNGGGATAGLQGFPRQSQRGEAVGVG